MGVQKKKLLHRIMALAIAVAVGLSVIVPGERVLKRRQYLRM